MRAEIRAVGRLKAGPERTLVDEYLSRATAMGRAHGLGPFTERESDPRTLKDRPAETAALLDGLEPGALVLALDETGRALSSLDFSRLLGRARDEGVRSAAFLIGGADGHERSALPAGARLISYGAATWPHRLVRVMLAEQLYRAVSLIAGSPYHREG
ncbi:MAG: 23S rRNA (pseudouridine(1915)-N(3))-methyltransferase RlmH [Oceanicaulis sp.]|nr:23S rRNA (pseudouridine(1915)-N(3))-methyltransferase RlmH [Oceanicaulis sp.]